MGSAGRRARVEHALAGRKAQIPGRELRRRILHRDAAGGKTRQRLDGQRGVEQHGARRKVTGRRGRARCRERGQVVGPGAAAQVHAQPHRRQSVVRIENLRPLVRPVPADSFDQPGRMAVARLIDPRHAGVERRALTLESAQHGVHEAASVAGTELARGIYRCRDGGMTRDPQLLELQQADAQQRAELRVAGFERPAQ
jgi:hypothetical protein